MAKRHGGSQPGIPPFSKVIMSDLSNAIQRGSLVRVRTILYVNPSFVNELFNSCTPLCIAVEYNQYQILQYLLSLPDVDVNLNNSVRAVIYHPLHSLFYLEYAPCLICCLSSRKRKSSGNAFSSSDDKS